MFPVCDMRGRVLGFGARKLGTARGPKYVNSPSGAIYCKSELLYGAHHARAIAAKTGIAIVVEGYIDALAMHQAGMVNTVALMGTSITEHQIARLKQLAPTAVLMLDGDDAGAAAILRAGALARPFGLEVLVATLPADTDPADLLQREGAPAVRELVADAGAVRPLPCAASPRAGRHRHGRSQGPAHPRAAGRLRRHRAGRRAGGSDQLRRATSGATTVATEFVAVESGEPRRDMSDGGVRRRSHASDHGA